MQENQIEHTFIVTADINSLAMAKHSQLALSIIQSALLLNGMRAEDKKRFDPNCGVYYSRKVKI
jgi:hypothetical protein